MTSNPILPYISCFCGWLIFPFVLVPLMIWLDRHGAIDRFLDRMKRNREK